jgi:hypothetical protein
MDFANSRQIQSIGVVNGFHNRYFAQHYRDGIVADPSYFWLDRVDRFMESRGGQHRLQFTNARDFVIGGGMLTHCLCEFLRDVLRSASIARSSYLRLILVTDAIYDMSVFGDRNMQAFIDLRGASELNRIIQERVVGQGGQRFCPQQNNFDFDRIFGFNYNVRVFLGDQKIGENSSVLSNAPQIDIVAIASNDLFSLFPMSTVGRPTEQRSLEPAR